MEAETNRRPRIQSSGWARTDRPRPYQDQHEEIVSLSRLAAEVAHQSIPCFPNALTGLQNVPLQSQLLFVQLWLRVGTDVAGPALDDRDKVADHPVPVPLEQLRAGVTPHHETLVVEAEAELALVGHARALTFGRELDRLGDCHIYRCGTNRADIVVVRLHVKNVTHCSLSQCGGRVPCILLIGYKTRRKHAVYALSSCFVS